MSTRNIRPMPGDFEPTRATLHAYANAIGVIPRAHAQPHPRWWHISLKPSPLGLETDEMPLPGGGACSLRMDLRSHEVVLETSRSTAARIPMADGLTGTEMGDAVIAAAGALDLSADYARAKFESDEARAYDMGTASAYFDVLTDIHGVFADHRATLEGEVGPLQVWPHGFDLAFEWFGTRAVEHEEDGEVERLPAQLNLGFYPADRPYLYSNPWPFEREQLLDAELPHDARWCSDEFEGSIYYYDELAGRSDAEARIRAYARAVFEAASPTLLS